MIRERLLARERERPGHRAKPTHFRWRGGEVSRLEGFTDAVFGFALTLLVVSLEVPRTFGDLLAALAGFGAFAVCFFILVFVWHRHYTYFRRYGLEDGWTVVLNAALLFVVLFFVYPLKFLYTLLPRLGHGPLPTVRLPDGATAPVITNAQIPTLCVLYSAGFAAVFLIFGLLYAHAYRRRRQLALNAVETVDTQESVASNFTLAGIGLLSIVLIYALRDPGPAMLSYLLIPVTETAIGTLFGVRRRRLERTLPEAP